MSTFSQARDGFRRQFSAQGNDEIIPLKFPAIDPDRTRIGINALNVSLNEVDTLFA